jgi:hypothetical protein
MRPAGAMTRLWASDGDLQERELYQRTRPFREEERIESLTCGSSLCQSLLPVNAECTGQCLCKFIAILIVGFRSVWKMKTDIK